MPDHGPLSEEMALEQDGDQSLSGWEWPDGVDDGGGGGQLEADLSAWSFPNEDTDCDCPGLPPPPQFALPPPPVPFSADCRDTHPGFSAAKNGLSELEYCDIQVLEGPYTQTAIPSIAVIVVCSFLMLVMVLVASLLFWKHKRKMQNFLPCKTSPTNHCDLTGGNSVLYEDLTNIRPRNLANHCTPNQTIAPMELLDIKCSNYGGAGFTPVGNTTFIYPPSADNNHVMKCSKSKDHFNNAYEEVSVSSHGGGKQGHSDVDSEEEEEEEDEEEEDKERHSPVSSEGELAEDELSLVDFPKKAYRESANGSHPCSGTSSLRGSTGDDLCHDFDSACSDDNESKPVNNRSAFQGGGFPFEGPLAEHNKRKRRHGKAPSSATTKGIDHIRSHHLPLPVILDAHPYPINGRQEPNGGMDDDEDEDDHLYDTSELDMSPDPPHPARMVLPPGGVGLPWRTPDMPLAYEVTPRELPRTPSELNVPKLGHHQHHPHPQRNNALYRDRLPPDYGKGACGTWGPEGGSQRNSDPHERNIAEFSTFRPRKGGRDGRDLYGLDAGLLNNDVGSYAHLPPSSQRSSGSDGSKGSNNSVERLLPPSAEGPYPHHHHYHPHQQQHLQQQHFLEEPSVVQGRRMAFPGHQQQQRAKRKQGEKPPFSDLEPPYGGRTVLT